MIRILMDRYSETEDIHTSLYTVFNDLEKILKSRFEIMKLPIIKGDNTFKIKQWINETGRYCDVFIGSSSLVINSLRETDWSGKVIFIALGSMPRGATSLRNCYRNLFCDDVIWFTSESDKEIYSELFSKENSPQPEVIPFGIHTDVFYPIDEKNIKSLRKKYDLECSDFILLYSGRITIEKNVHGILESLAFLVNMNLPVKLVIVGRIEDNSFYEFKMAGINIKSRIEKIIKKLNITSQVIFIDWVSQEQLNEFYNIANVIVNYSLHHDENYGFSQIQAMATGKPVIGTAWGGFKDYIIDGVTGFSAGTYISDFGIRYDMPSLVRAIFELYKDSNFSKELGKNGLDYVNSNFSFKIYKERMISLVERVTNNNKLRGNHLTLTDFGTKFHERFSYKEDDKLVSLFPQYSDLADDDYKRLIKPYTSYDHFPENKCNFFLAIAGDISDSYFVSTDILYQFRYKLTFKQIQILKLLSRYYGKTIRLSEIEENEVLTPLLLRGIVGQSSVCFVNGRLINETIS